MTPLRSHTLLALSLLVPTSAVAVPAPASPALKFQPSRFTTQVVGSGPDVILIPGLTASRDIWRSTVAAIPGFRYHLVQVSGFAGAPARGNVRGPMLAPLADEIARYIAARHLDRPTLVGHSMGGTLALMVASRHPQRVGKLMVVDMLPQPAALLGSSAASMSGVADLLQGLAGSESGRGLLAAAIAMFGSDPAADVRSDPDVVARAAHELATTDLTREIPKISAPLSVVFASPEPTQGRLIEQRYRSAYAGKRSAKLVRIDGSGHMIMYDRPTAFRAALRRFLAE